MQSSFENSSNSAGANNLEEGELTDDDDDELWKQIEDFENLGVSKNCEKSTDKSTTYKKSRAKSPRTVSPVSNSAIAKSTKSLSISNDVHSDRIVGGFWAKLTKKAVESTMSVSVGSDNVDRTVSLTNRKNQTTAMCASDLDSSSENAKSILSNFSDQFVYRGHEFDRNGEKRRSSKETRTDSSNQHVFRHSGRGGNSLSTHQTSSFDSIYKKLRIAEENDDELMELELRLKALQSTMKRDETMATRQPFFKSSKSNDSHKDKPSRIRTDVSVTKSRRKPSKSRTRNGRTRTSDEHRKKEATDLQQTDHERVRSHHRQHSQKSTRKSPKRRSPLIRNVPSQLHQERERILKIPDPEQQYRAFLDLVTTARSIQNNLDDASSSGFYGEDNFEVTNMDISTDTEGDTADSGNSCTPISGFWRRLSASFSKSPVAKAEVTEVIENGTSSSELNKQIEASPEENDDEEEEMAALRELALKSMMKAKTENTSPVSTSVTGNSSLPLMSHLSSEKPSTSQPLSKDLNSSTDSGDIEVVIKLDQELVKKRTQLARRKASKESCAGVADGTKGTSILSKDKPITTIAKKSMEKKVNLIVAPHQQVKDKSTTAMKKPTISAVADRPASSSSPSLYANDFRRPNAQFAWVKNDIQRIPPKVIHQPVVIPFDDSDTDEDNYEMAVNQQQEPRLHVSANAFGNFAKRDAINGICKSVGAIGNQGLASDNSTTKVSLISQLEERLRVCVDDLTKHQNHLDEDKKRLTTLQSIVARKKTDLRSAEMKMRKLKEELRHLETQTAISRITIAKFNVEIQKVQSRVDKNVGLHLSYFRQWSEIKQLVAKHKIDVMPKMPQTVAAESTIKDLPDPATGKRSLPIRPSIPRKRRSQNSNKAATLKRRRLTSSKQAQGTKRETNKIIETRSGSSQLELIEDVFSNPLRWLKSYRLSRYSQNSVHCTLTSPTFSNKLNPFVPLCPFELSGRCLDPECQWQHEKDYTFNEVELIADLLSYRPAVVTEQADEKVTKIFAEQLYNSLRAKMSLDEILSYCFTKLQSHVCNQGGETLNIETEPRKWFVQQLSNRYSQDVVDWRKPQYDDQISIENDQRQEAVNFRYFHNVLLDDVEVDGIKEPSPSKEDENENEASEL